MKNTIELTKENFKKEVLESNLPVLVDFYAGWCGPCKMLDPTIELLAEAYLGSIIVAKLNVDSNEDITSEYAVSSIPTILLFKNGKVVEKIIRANPMKTYQSAIEKILIS